MNEKKYSIIAVLDIIEDKLVQQSLELIAFADKIISSDISHLLLIVPGKNTLRLCESISSKYGIDTAAIECDELYLPDPELLSGILSLLIDIHKPELVLFTHTMRNCQVISKLSILCKAGSVTGVESFTSDDEGIVFLRSAFNGKLKENVRLKTSIKLVTVLPGAYSIDENSIPYNNDALAFMLNLNEASGHSSEDYVQSPDASGSTDSLRRSAAFARGGKNGYVPVSLSAEKDGGVKLEDADVIVAAGRGVGKEENLQLIRDTACIFSNAAIGASRPICDQKWIPLNQQVGVTGKTVTPKLYIACGISGSQQHIAGMKNSQCIVAINKDPNASIFAVSDYIVVEDLLLFLPVLIEKYKEKYGG